MTLFETYREWLQTISIYINQSLVTTVNLQFSVNIQVSCLKLVTDKWYLKMMIYGQGKTNRETFPPSVFSDLSGKMFTFPQKTNTAYVKLITSDQNFNTLTVCHRYHWMCKMHKCPHCIAECEKYHDINVFVMPAGHLQTSKETMPFSLWLHPLMQTTFWSSGMRQIRRLSPTSVIGR